MNLTSDDYAMLNRSWITSEIADAAGIFRAPSLEACELVGRKNKANYDGLVFPYRWPGSDGVLLHRLRLDNPPLDSATGKTEYRYLQAPGTRNHLYFPPCDPVLLEDVNLPIVMTEGEKKDLALWRAALELGNGAGQPAFLPAAVAGASSWRGTIGSVTNAKGERIPEKGVLPDFSRIPWTGRKVTILFDSNAISNFKVRAARAGLAKELTRRGAKVALANLPESAGVNGIDDYLAQVGLSKAMSLLHVAVPYEWYDELLRSDKGKVLRVLANANIALRSAPEWMEVLAFDEFSSHVTTTRSTPWGFAGKWTDQEDRLLTDWLQHRGVLVNDLDASKAVEAVARDRPYHPVKDYLNSVKWDGIHRLGGWLRDYLGVEESEFSRAVGEKWLISAVARIFEPGCKADHCLIVEGPQGSLKSTAFGILGDPWFTDDIPSLESKDAALGTIGKWIIELAELDAMSRAEMAPVKAFMSRRTDHVRPPYGRHFIELPRQCVFVGTVNHSEYLRDETGGRRFWPVKAGRINIEALRRDRDQLWAEAVVEYRKGTPWWLDTPELNEAAAKEQDARFQADPWEDPIAAWIEGRAGVTTAEILRTALEKTAQGSWIRADEMRVGAILRRLGWNPRRRVRPRIYVPPELP
jgi:predicted P-loop ATPase